jgi:exodeoxyribonuclease V alpha subunit
VTTENPYRLTRDVRGIGFKTADAIAIKLGIEKTAMIRLRAGVSFALAEAMDEGHCGLPTEKLIPLAIDLLEAREELIVTALDLERSEGNVIADNVAETPCTFLAGLYRAEQNIADRLIKITIGRLPWPRIDEDKALPWIEKRSGLQLAESQKDAIRLALTAKVLVITGGRASASRASAMARALSKSLIVQRPSPPSWVSPRASAPQLPNQSVQAAGMRDRLPSGSTASNNGTPRRSGR